MTVTTASAPRRAATTSVFAGLLLRYIAGQIEDAPWRQFMQAVDAEGATTQERVALAAFVHDLVADHGPDGLKLPDSAEIQDVLGVSRAA